MKKSFTVDKNESVLSLPSNGSQRFPLRLQNCQLGPALTPERAGDRSEHTPTRSFTKGISHAAMVMVLCWFLICTSLFL